MPRKALRGKLRTAFMENYGARVAGSGGSFGTYRTARDGWNGQKKYAFAPYGTKHPNNAGIRFMERDFTAFERGFNEFQKLRIGMQVAQRDAQAECHRILVKMGR